MQITDTILMVRPAAFGPNKETASTNFFQTYSPGLSDKEIQQSALHEFDRMVELLKEKDINILVIDDTQVPPKPSAIFPNNWLSTTSNGLVHVFPMYAKSRREEKKR